MTTQTAPPSHSERCAPLTSRHRRRRVRFPRGRPFPLPSRRSTTRRGLRARTAGADPGPGRILRRWHGALERQPPRRLALCRRLPALAVLAFAGRAAGSEAGGPVATVTPSVIGTAAAGKHLTGLSGSWGGFGAITYRFQWYRCNAAGASCLSIQGATSPTLALGARDVGKTLGLTVSATDSTGSTSAYASLVGPIAPEPAAPRVDRAAGRDRPARRGQDRRGDDGNLEPRPGEPELRLGALQLERPCLRRDPACHLELSTRSGAQTSVTRCSPSSRPRTARSSRTRSAPRPRRWSTVR